MTTWADLLEDPQDLAKLPGFKQWDAHDPEVEAEMQRVAPKPAPRLESAVKFDQGTAWDDIFNAPPRKKDFWDALKEIGEHPLKTLDPTGAVEGYETWQLVDAANALEQGHELSKDQKRVLFQLAQDQQAGGTRGYRAASIAGAMPSWGLGLALGGAVEKIGVAGARKLIGKAVKEAVLESAERAAAGGVVEFVKRGALATGKAAADIVARQAVMEGMALGADALAGVGPKGGRVAAEAWRQAMPELDLQDQDLAEGVSIGLKSGVRDFVSVLGPATIASLIETGTELYGSNLMKLPILNRIEALEASAVRWLARKTGAKGSELVSSIARQGGFGGRWVGEYAEEVEADILHSITPGDPGYGKGVPSLTDADQIATTLSAFALGGAAMGGAHALLGGTASGSPSGAVEPSGSPVEQQLPAAVVGPSPMPPMVEAPATGTVQPAAEPAQSPAAASEAPPTPAKEEPNLPPAETWTPAQVAKEMGVGPPVAEAVARTHNEQFEQGGPEAATAAKPPPVGQEEPAVLAGAAGPPPTTEVSAELQSSSEKAQESTQKLDESSPEAQKLPTEAELDAKLEELNRARLERPKSQEEAAAQEAKVEALDKEVEKMEAAVPEVAAAEEEPEPAQPPGMRYVGRLAPKGGGDNYIEIGVDKEGHFHHTKNGLDAGAWPVRGIGHDKLVGLVSEGDFEPSKEFADEVAAIQVENAERERIAKELSGRARAESDARQAASSAVRQRHAEEFAGAGRGWKKGTFTPHVEQGEAETVPAWISPSGLFAITKKEGRYNKTPYVVHHVPTGFRVSHGTATRVDAQQLVARLQKIPSDWASKDPKAIVAEPHGRTAHKLILTAESEGGLAPTEAEIQAELPEEFRAKPEPPPKKKKRARSGSKGTMGFPDMPDTPIGGRMLGALASKPGARAPRLSTLHRSFEAVLRAAKSASPIRIGRIKGGPRGWFRPSTGVVRIRTYGNLATYAHELGHAFEAAVFGWESGGPWKSPLIDKAMRAELLEMGKNLYPKPPTGGWKREGFAEFLRLWITGEDTSGIQPKRTHQAAAPAFTAFWEKGFLPSQPASVLAAFDRLRALVAEHRNAGARARIEAQVIDPGSIGERWRKIRKALGLEGILTELVEIGRPLQLISQEVQKKHPETFGPHVDPYGWFKAKRMVHSGMVADWISHGVTNTQGERVAEPLSKIPELVRAAERDERDFSLYLYARRSVALWRDPMKPAGRHPGISLQDAEQLLLELDAPQMAEAARILYDWYDAAMDYAGEMSPTFQQAIDRIRAVDPGDYVPLKRMFEDIDATALRQTQGTTGSAVRGQVAKKLHGSGRPIKDVLPQLVAQAEELVLRAHQRKVIDTLIAISKENGMGHVAEKVAKDQVPGATVSVGEALEAIKKKLQAQGIVLAVARPMTNVETGETEVVEVELRDIEEVITFFAPADSPRGTDPVVPIFSEGVVEWYRVPEAVYRSLMGMDVAQLSKWAAPLVWMRRMKTMGTTGVRPAWALFNIVKDLQTFMLNSKANGWGPRHLVHWFWALGEAFTAAATGERVRTKWLDAYLRMGLAMEKSLTYDVNASKAEIRRLFQHGFTKVIDPRNIWEWMAGMIQFGEVAPRLAEFRLIAQELGWSPGDPMSEATAIQLSLAAKEVTIDFGEAGRFTRMYGRVVPFLTASIAGPRAALRAIQDHPGRYAAIGLMYSLGGLALWWKYKDEDWWKEMPDDEKWRYLHIPSEDETTMVRIPLAYDGPQAFYGMAVALADAAYTQDPEPVREMLGVLVESMTPPIFPGAGVEALEQAANRDFFFDMPIVPQGSEDRPARQQYTAYTTQAAILVSELAHKVGVEVAPARIDHAITGLFGGLPMDILKETGLGPAESPGRTGELSELPVIGRLWQRGGALGTRLKSVEEVYERRAEQTQRKADLEHKETTPERTERLIIEDAAKAITVLGWIRHETPDADVRFRLTREVLAIARDALRRSRTSKDPLLYQKKRTDLEKKWEAMKPGTASPTLGRKDIQL